MSMQQVSQRLFMVSWNDEKNPSVRWKMLNVARWADEARDDGVIRVLYDELDRKMASAPVIDGRVDGWTVEMMHMDKGSISGGTYCEQLPSVEKEVVAIPDSSDQVFIAQLETLNFSFVATGRTADEAMCALEKGWLKHAAEYSHRFVAPFDEFRDLVRMIELPMGGVSRDGDLLTKLETKDTRPFSSMSAQRD